jgi:hypothetical protein
MTKRPVLLAVALMGFISCCAQQDITLHVHHITLGKMVDTVEKLGNCRISYPGKGNFYNDISLDVDHASLQLTMEKALSGLPLAFSIDTTKSIALVFIWPIPIPQLRGKVLDNDNQPLEDVVISVLHTQNYTITNNRGGFILKNVPDNAILDISGLPVKNHRISVGGRSYLIIRIPRNILNLTSLTLSYTNGLQRVPAANATGSYVTADKSTLGHVVGPNIVDHFYGQLCGLNAGGPGNFPGFSVRGRNTLNSPGIPLFVVDGFANPGSTAFINPSDVESITVLKDAAASGVWGAYSDNGVAVVSSRTGQYNLPRIITVTSNTTVSGRPDLSYIPRMGSASYIGAEQTLFDRHYYDKDFSRPLYPITPAVDLLRKKRDQLLLPGDADAAIARLASHNVLSDLRKYYYRSSIAQQCHISAEGGDQTQNYYVSLGYDHDPTALVRNKYERITAHGAYTFRPSFPKLEISGIFNFASITNWNNNPGNIPVPYPYASLSDASGHPLPVAYKYNPAYIDTVGGGYLQDWHYRPLDELALADNRSTQLNGYLVVMAKYRIVHALSINILYRYMTGHSYSRDHYNKDGFFVRDLANTFAEPKTQERGFIYPVPVADIMITGDTTTTANNLRTELSWQHVTDSNNQWMAFAGGESGDLETTGQTQRIYGFNGHGGNKPMDLVNSYPIFITGVPEPIPTNNGFLGLVNRSISLFSNASYTYRHLYTFYGAFRMDATNIVGGRKWAPFWSLGVNHNLTPHLRDTSKLPPLLMLRASFGCNGNIGNRTAYLVTQSLDNNVYGAIQNGIVGAPDPALTWEKTYILNTGIDFSFFRDSVSRHGRLYGSLDVYWRHATDLLSYDTLTPSAGVASFLGNTAGITGEGIDLAINSVNTRGRVKWVSTLLFSVSRDHVSHYLFQPVSPAPYVSGYYLQVGKSSTALFSYRWAGLDPSNGDPRGFVKNEVSKNYTSIMNSPDGGMSFSGSWLPVTFGSLINTISWGRFSLYTRLGFKLGYSFRRSSINYNDLITGVYPGHRDYDKRWMATGDEKKTSVPSFPDVNNPDRDIFYQNSDILITKGDHVRWQDCSLSYDWKPKARCKMPVRQATFYVYVNNIAILWRANRYGIDPDAAAYGAMPAVRTWSLGVKLKL